jgi:uncharacterized membrane protein (UPF0127 family)
MSRIEVADTPVRRLRGLMFRRAPAAPLLLTRTSSVHTCFMRFPLDVTFLDARGRVLREVRLRPWRAAWCRGAAYALEAPYCRTASPSPAGR